MACCIAISIAIFVFNIINENAQGLATGSHKV